MIVAATQHMTTSGPAFDVHGWVAAVVIVGAVAASIIAAAGLLRLILGFRLLRWAAHRLVGEPFTVWTRHTVGTIVSGELDEFRHQLIPNGGASIPDRLGRIEGSQKQLSAHLDEQDRRVAAQGQKIDDLHEYTHEWRHRVSGDMAAMKAAETAAEAALTKVQASLEELQEAKRAISTISTANPPTTPTEPS